MSISIADLEKAKQDIEDARRHLMSREAELNAARQKVAELEQDLVEMGVSPQNVDATIQELSEQFSTWLQKLRALVQDLSQ